MRIHRIIPTKIGIIYIIGPVLHFSQSYNYVLNYVHTMSVMGKLNIKNDKTICLTIIHVVNSIAIYMCVLDIFSDMFRTICCKYILL